MLHSIPPRPLFAYVWTDFYNKMPFKCFPCVFLTPAIKLSTQISKSKIVIRGTKDRPPQGVPEKGCHTSAEKSLINNNDNNNNNNNNN